VIRRPITVCRGVAVFPNRIGKSTSTFACWCANCPVAIELAGTFFTARGYAVWLAGDTATSIFWSFCQRGGVAATFPHSCGWAADGKEFSPPQENIFPIRPPPLLGRSCPWHKSRRAVTGRANHSWRLIGPPGNGLGPISRGTGVLPAIPNRIDPVAARDSPLVFLRRLSSRGKKKKTSAAQGQDRTGIEGGRRKPWPGVGGPSDR